MEAKPKDKKQNPVKWINPLKDRTRVVPFVVPDEEARMAALGSLAGQKWRLKKSLQAIIPFFLPIKTPGPNDHLFLFEEDGQSFPLYTSVMKNYISLQKQIIYIATFYCSISKENILKIKKQAKHFFYGCKVKLHHIQQIPLANFGEKISENEERYYDAAKLNQYFKNHLPKNAYSMAIITNLLIYNGDNPLPELKDNYVFGLGCVKDRMSVISFEEIVKKGYGNKKPEDQEAESEHNLKFLTKVVNHELCHTFGIRHCIHYTCLMNGSNQYPEAVQKVGHLCPVCVRKLQHNIGFDMCERYHAMGDSLSKKLEQAIEVALNQVATKNNS